MWVSILFVSLAHLGAATHTALTDPPSPGTWSGGFGSYGPERVDYEVAIVELEVDGKRLRGRLEDNRGSAVPLTGSWNERGLRFQVKRDGKTLRFQGSVEEGVLRGECRVGGRDVQLLLVHEQLPGREEIGELHGMYAVEGELGIAIRASRHPILQGFESGARRVLYHRGEDRYAGGERFAVPLPRELSVTFERDAEGAVSALTLRDADGRSRRGVRVPLRHEAFSFQSGDVTLRGSLTLPASPGPFPAAVWVHGSGRARRVSAGVWPQFFAARGFAFLAVDKRGVGESGGTYEMPDGGHDNEPHMARRAGDVAAAVHALRARDDVLGERIGLIGGSQAGWVIPQAAAPAGAAFAIVISGGTTAFDYENVFSRWSGELESDASNPSIDALYERLRAHTPRDRFRREWFTSIPCPGLWLFGALDRSNPSLLCVEHIEDLRDTAGKDFEVVLYPTGNHSLNDAVLGGPPENLVLSRTVPGLFQTVERWLADHELLAR